MRYSNKPFTDEQKAALHDEGPAGTLARIEMLMRGKDMKFADLSRATGIPLSTITTWKYKGQSPKTDRLPAVARALGTTTDYLLTGRGDTLNGAAFSPLSDFLAKAGTEDREMILEQINHAVEGSARMLRLGEAPRIEWHEDPAAV